MAVWRTRRSASLPIWVQTPFVPGWRAPVSSTVIQPAAAQPDPQHLARLVAEAHLPAFSRRITCRLEMLMPMAAQLCHQTGHSDLALVVLRQHEPTQLRPEVADHPGRHRRRTVRPSGVIQRSRR